MNTLVELVNGRQAGLTGSLSIGDTWRIGSAWECECCIREDPELAGCAAAITQSKSGAAIHAFGVDPPVLLNGSFLQSASLSHGDWVHVGQNLLRIHCDPEKDVERDTPVDALLALLARSPEPHFVLWDGALEPQLTEFAKLHLELVPLLELQTEESRTAARPYLARLPLSSSAGVWLVRAAWGRGRLVIFRSMAGIDQLQEHFRSFLFGHRHGDQAFLFRVFDPRVLRLTLRCMPPQDAADFFGPVRFFLIEDRLPGAILEFGVDQGSLTTTRHCLARSDSRIPQQWELAPRLSQLAAESDNALVRVLEESHPGIETSWVRNLMSEGTAHGLQSDAAMLQSMLLSCDSGRSIWADEELATLTRTSAVGVDAALELYTLAINQRRRLA